MTKSMPFNTSDIPDLNCRVALITGGHSGLGLATTTALAAKNAKVYIASRSVAKAEEAIRGIRRRLPNAQIEVIEMDLGDLRSVKKGAEDFLRRESKLHILINNAGIMCTPFSLTPQNREIQLATNYLSHFLLSSLLLPTLLSTSAPRVVNVASDGHKKLAPKQGVMFEDMNLENKGTWTRYGHSKLCNVLHARALAKRYGGEGLVSVSLHPGTVKTNLSAGPRKSTPIYKLIQPLVEWGAPGPEEGCANIIWCAVSTGLGELVKGDEGVNGCYFEPVGKLKGVSDAGKDDEMAERLWEWSEETLKRDGLFT
ncbi:related to reductases [Phialocephala subalpina]|uniref:Related to reductases n=1 Tax=Phialocephala subalpina TaxID=576137 RepID=A0A1L7XI21_9HELO|nr:related to reductases [Phialocephala subalpina]